MSNSSHNQVTGNTAVDTSPAPTQEYAIIETNGSNDNTISGNYVAPNKRGTLVITGVSTRVFNNVGYTTESKGTATIIATSVVVNHGLSYSPTAGDCWALAAEIPTHPVGTMSIGSYTPTQFTVTVASDPGASDLDIVWGCRK